MGDDFWSNIAKIYGVHTLFYPIIWRHIPDRFPLFAYAVNIPTTATLPPFGLTSPVQPWMTWEEDFSIAGFGNRSFSTNYWKIAGTKIVTFVSDPVAGD